jgi:cell division protein FtsW (lipid II flippase)
MLLFASFDSPRVLDRAPRPGSFRHVFWWWASPRWWHIQTFLNIGVVTGLLPTTGISLPFFSYGGTALSLQLAEMGVVLSVSRQMKPTKAG